MHSPALAICEGLPSQCTKQRMVSPCAHLDLGAGTESPRLERRLVAWRWSRHFVLAVASLTRVAFGPTFLRYFAYVGRVECRVPLPLGEIHATRSLVAALDGCLRATNNSTCGVQKPRLP
jgi:hypothetical protein